MASATTSGRSTTRFRAAGRHPTSARLGPNGDVPFEVQTGNTGGTFAQDGNALVELDSHFGSGYLNGGDHFNDSNPAHTNATSAGDRRDAGRPGLRLTFWYAPRGDGGEGNEADSGSMNVLWNGEVVKSIDSTGMPLGVWQQITVMVDGTGPNNVLGFQGTGQENTFGAFIDNVSLVPVISVDEDGLTGPWSFGNHDSQPGDNIVRGYGCRRQRSDRDRQPQHQVGCRQFRPRHRRRNVRGYVPFLRPGSAGRHRQSQRHIYQHECRGQRRDNAVVAWRCRDVLLNADGTVLTGSAGSGETQRDVIRISLSDEGTGQFRVVLLDQLDHAPGGNENDIGLRFNYTATDSDGDAVNGSFIVNVDDDVPVAVDDTITTPITCAFTTGDLLSNDSFGADGPASSGLVTFTNGEHGTVVYNDDGTFTYTPTAGYKGSDSFTYTIMDGDGDTSTATVTLSNIHTETHHQSAYAAVAAEIHHGGGNIDLSALHQPGADHAPAQSIARRGVLHGVGCEHDARCNHDHA